MPQSLTRANLNKKHRFTNAKLLKSLYNLAIPITLVQKLFQPYVPDKYS